jgi:hypothetical protein
VPDAKAFTDAPESMIVLMKQRRRWMNGAMFGTKKVLGNCVNMVSCKRTTHGGCAKCLMVVYMIYMILLFTLQWFIVGAMFASIYAFFANAFALLVEGNWNLQEIYKKGFLNWIFAGLYCFLLVQVLILSLAMPLDKGKAWFTIVTILFGILSILTVVGMMFFFAGSGIYPEAKCYSPTDQKYYPCNPDNPPTYEYGPEGPPHYFSVLVFCGAIMLSIYLVPIIYRPVDFLKNFMSYTVGLICYMLLIPMFSNVFTIYSMCNLHDISWGNRPETTGQEAFTESAKQQATTKSNYEVFRSTVLFMWIACNAAYFFVVLNLPSSNDPEFINNGSFAWLQGFTCMLASIVVFRMFFSALYILRWKCRFCCDKQYSVQTYNMEKVFRKIKKTANTGGMSSDDEDVIARARKVYKEKARKINKKKKLHEGMSERKKLEATLEYLHDQDLKKKKDQGKMEFNDAAVEEIEDKILEERAKKGHALTTDDVSRISKNIKPEEMNQSIMSNVLGDVGDFISGRGRKESDKQHSRSFLGSQVMF